MPVAVAVWHESAQRLLDFEEVADTLYFNLEIFRSIKMAKKKAQHLYELLAQKTREAQQAEPKSKPVASPQPVQKQEAPRRFVPAAQPPMIPPAPVEPGHGHILEDVITLRRDTAIVGAVLMVVLLVVAFVIGRATAPGRDIPARMRGITYTLNLKTYPNTVEGRAEAEAAKKLVEEKGYKPSVEEFGDTVRLIVPGFRSPDGIEATKALGELSNMTIKDEKPFKDAYFK
jgi:hypothetical protein